MADLTAHVPALPDERCNWCQAAIVWALTTTAKRMPLDAVPTVNGNVCLTWDPEAKRWRATVETVWERQSPAWAEVPRHVHHGTTCPDAKHWWPSAQHAKRPRDVAGVHEKAAPSKPDQRGAPSGRAPALHPGSARPEQEAMF